MKSKISTKVLTSPATQIASNNFYFLVKVCGISPLDIPHMTPFQVQTLIYQHNKHEKEKEEKLKQMEAELEKKRTKRRIR